MQIWGQDVGITVHTVMGLRWLDETIQRKIIAKAIERVNAEVHREALQHNTRKRLKLKKETESRNQRHKNPMAESGPMLG